MPPAPSQWGLRVRSALLVVVILTIALGAATLALTLVLYRSLVSASDDLATARLRQIAYQLQLDAPDDLDNGGLVPDSQITAIQILDANAAVVASSPGSPARPMVTELPAPDSVRHGLRPEVGCIDDVRISTLTTTSPLSGTHTVVVALDQEELENTIELVAVLVGIGAPFIVALAAASTYALVSRSLGSVERIRTRVAAISIADLTDRVPVPRQRDEIAALAHTMNDMLTRIQNGHDAQRRFVGDASHELRSPLTTITAALELGHARPELLDADLIAETLLPEAERMRRLTQDLLLLARADEHDLRIHPVDTDLDDILTTEIRRLRGHTTLTVTTAVQPVRISGDPDQIQRVVLNLLDNAARYADSTVEVRLARDDGTARLEIGDDGPGIPDDERERVFDRFYRIQHDRSRHTGGTGLGLAIVAEIVTAHHGSVHIERSSAGGALVVIELPASE
nr:ATP-binding protein [Nocardia bovistercoris]